MTYEALTSHETLLRAWARVRENAGVHGGDGMSIEEFEIDLDASLGLLHEQLATGSYRPGPLRPILIPKDDGTMRRLAVPTVRDRIVQTAAHLILRPTLEKHFEDASYAYRPGRSVRMAVTRIADLRRRGYTWVVDGDIERYFDNVPHDRLLARLAGHVTDTRTLDLIRMWLAGFSPGGRGLPQGSPISPLLSNLYLDSVDEAVEANGVRLVRYADDFVVLCKTEAKAQATLDRLKVLLGEHGLRLHPDKTRLVTFDQGFQFLGHLFVRALVLEQEEEQQDSQQGPDERQPAPRSKSPVTAPPFNPPRIEGPDLAADAPMDEPPPVDEAAVVGNSPTTEFPVTVLPEDGHAPGLRVLYVHEKGRTVGRRQRAFAIRGPAGNEIAALPRSRVDRIEIGPDAEIESDAIRLACSEGGHVALVTKGGTTQVLCHGFDDDAAGLHLEQARHCLDPARRLDLARRIVDGKLRNQRALLRRLNRRRKDATVDSACESIGEGLERVAGADSIDTLMGFEGSAAATYWPALGRCFDHGWQLERRQRRPPPDPVNVVLSYLSAMLARDILGLCLRKGLHPGFGALHTARDGHPALASDIMEEFRAPVVEALTAFLLNTGSLQKEMFSAQEDGICHLEPAGRSVIIHGYERWLAKLIRSPRSGEQAFWRRIVEEQVVAYMKHIRGEADYVPYLMDY